MGIRLRPIGQGKEPETSSANEVQFGAVYKREVPEREVSKTGVALEIVVVVHAVKLCQNATEVYVAPVVGCKEKSAFSFRIKGFKGERLPEGAGIDLAGIRMVGVDKLGVRLGRLEALDLWRLDEGLKDLFGAGQ